MSTSPKLPHLVLRIALCFVLGCPLLPRLAHGQPAQNTPNELDSAIATARSKSNVVSGRDVVVIANAGAVQAIPALEEQFKRATDVDTKVSIASGLVKLKDRDDSYWNFLLEQATLAVDSNIPDSVFSESQGKATILGPELQAWADAHNVSVNTAGVHARYDFPSKVLELAATGDPRGIPLLRRALQSRNYLIVTWATKGLAQIQDKESIPLPRISPPSPLQTPGNPHVSLYPRGNLHVSGEKGLEPPPFPSNSGLISRHRRHRNQSRRSNRQPGRLAGASSCRPHRRLTRMSLGRR